MKNTSPYVAIIDYQMSNLYSVQHACEALGIRSVITSDPSELLRAKAAILPGVGAFSDAMNNLRRFGLIAPIRTFIRSGRKFMGVCLGMQLLFTKSHEFGSHKGFGFLDGDVVKFPSHQMKVPQIGWNTIYKPSKKEWDSTPFKKIKNNTYMYFVHSYYVRPKKKSSILSLTSYEGVEYCSSVLDKNIFTVQFHPEKSGPGGVRLYTYLI